MRRPAKPAAVTLGRVRSVLRRARSGAHEHPRHWPPQGASSPRAAASPSTDRAGARDRAGTPDLLRPSARLAGRRGGDAVRVLLRPRAHDEVAERKRIRRARGSVRRDARSRHPRRARRRLAARTARTRGRDDGLERTAGDAARRACALEARAACREGGRLAGSGRDVHRAANCGANAERRANTFCARCAEQAQQPSPALPGSRIAAVGWWWVFV